VVVFVLGYKNSVIVPVWRYGISILSHAGNARLVGPALPSCPRYGRRAEAAVQDTLLAHYLCRFGPVVLGYQSIALQDRPAAPQYCLRLHRGHARPGE